MDAGEGAPTPAHGRPDPRKARRQETAALARTLAAAFEHDPPMAWALRDASRRRAMLERAFLLYLKRLWLRHEETYVVADGAGVCVWEPPGEWKVGAGEQLTLLPAMTRIFGRRLPRVLRGLRVVEGGHPQSSHYFLAALGVEPASQGHGYGSTAMHPVIDRCDADRVPAYLEATTVRNRALYERHGFEVTEEFRLGRGSPLLWRMWREPG